MLEITPLQTREERSSAAVAVGARFIEDSLAYVALSDGKAIALCQFKITGEGGEIHSLDSITESDSCSLLSVLCRSVLSFIELCGEERAYYLDTDTDERLIASIGFQKDDCGKLSLKLR